MLALKLALEKNHFGYFEYDNPDVQKGTKFSESAQGQVVWAEKDFSRYRHQSSTLHPANPALHCSWPPFQTFWTKSRATQTNEPCVYNKWLKDLLQVLCNLL